MKKILIAFSSHTYSFLDVFDCNNSLSEISDKLISSDLIYENLSDIEYFIDGRIAYDYVDMTITYSGDNGIFTVKIVEHEIK